MVELTINKSKVMIEFMENQIINQLRYNYKLSNDKLYELTTFDPNKITSPFEMNDALDFINLLAECKFENIGIIPDYDADGILSGSLLYASLFELGFKSITLYTPRIDTGYGMSIQSVDEIRLINPNVNVIITTDNGIAANEGVNYAKSLGIKVLVSDHHIGSENEPNFDVAVNPNKLNDLSTFKGSSGTVVIWKLMVVFAHTYKPESMTSIYNLFPLAGISLISDVMPMIKENRTLVTMTINVLKKGKFELYRLKQYALTEQYARIFDGLIALFDVFEINDSLKYGVDEDFIGFTLAPMLNAPRRMTSTSELGFKLFVQLTNELPFDIAKELFEVNKQRKELVNTIVQKVVEQIDESYDETPNIIVAAVDTKTGIAGLISSNITNKFNVPSIVFAANFINETGQTLSQAELMKSGKKTLSASARSNEDINLKIMLDNVNEKYPNVLNSYGGHAGAAGLSINVENYDIFIAAINDVFNEALSKLQNEHGNSQNNQSKLIKLTTSVIPYFPQAFDVTNEEKEILIETFDFLQSLKPFGEQFREPLFELILPKTDFTSQLIKISTMGAKSNHLKLVSPNLVAIYWNVSDKIKEKLNSEFEYISIVGKLSLNEFRGKKTVQIIINDLDFN